MSQIAIGLAHLLAWTVFGIDLLAVHVAAHVHNRAENRLEDEWHQAEADYCHAENDSDDATDDASGLGSLAHGHGANLSSSKEDAE